MLVLHPVNCSHSITFCHSEGFKSSQATLEITITYDESPGSLRYSIFFLHPSTNFDHDAFCKLSERIGIDSQMIPSR